MYLQPSHRRRSRAVAVALLLGGLALGFPGKAAAQAINPQVFKQRFEKTRAGADVVADVRTLVAACTKAEDAGGGTKKLTLQLGLHVLKADKGIAKPGEVLLVTHEISWNNRPGPALYGRQGTLRSFPCVAGATGQVALRWDNERRCYAVLAGWVPELPQAAPPQEAGKATVAPEGPQPK